MAITALYCTLSAAIMVASSLLQAFVAVLLLLCESSWAWVSREILPLALRRSTSRLWSQLPANYQEYGTELIRQAGAQIGATGDQLDIEWKGDKIVVTVHGDTYAGMTQEDDDDDDMDDDGGESNDSGLQLSEDDADLLSVSSLEEEKPTGINVIALARAINHILDDGNVGLRIAECHEIEVTTPGATDEVVGVVMFEAYKGFEVIAQHQDPKSKKLKTVEGKLVERNDEFTIVNIKGRMKKMTNENVVSVKLPKAKKDKGVG